MRTFFGGGICCSGKIWDTEVSEIKNSTNQSQVCVRAAAAVASISPKKKKEKKERSLHLDREGEKEGCRLDLCLCV